MGDTDALIANDGVRVLYGPRLVTEAAGTLTPPVDGQLQFVVGNGHSYWKSKSIAIRVRDDSGRARFPTEPFAPMHNASSEAWDLALYGLVGKITTGRQWNARRDARGRFLFPVPRSRGPARRARRGGAPVTWDVDVEEHDARVSVVFKAAAGRVHGAGGRQRPGDGLGGGATEEPPPDERSDGETIHALRRSLVSARTDIGVLSGKLRRQTDALGRQKADLDKAHVALNKSMERTLTAETARARLRTEVTRLRDRKHELQLSLNRAMFKIRLGEAQRGEAPLVGPSDGGGAPGEPPPTARAEGLAAPTDAKAAAGGGGRRDDGGDDDDEPTLVDTHTNKPMRCPKTASSNHNIRPKPSYLVKRKARSCCW